MTSQLKLAAATAALLLASAGAFGQYPAQGVRFLSNIPLNQFPGNPSSGAGGWGYVSPSGREYALMELSNGTSVVEITNPTAPVQVAHISGPNSTWHEIAVLGDFAYAVTEAGGGMQIIDLRNVDSAGPNRVTLAATYTTGGFSKVHTVQANPVTKYVYANGTRNTTNQQTGFIMLDVSIPTMPIERARWTQEYVHDAQIVNYTSGPYAGKEIAFLCCGSKGLYIVDITNKQAISTMGDVQYFGSDYYCHSGQLSADGRYFYINDEFDEGNGLVGTATTHIIDVSDLSNPVLVGSFSLPTSNFIDHNSHRVGNTLFLAAYRGGLRIYDLTNPTQLTEMGYFDTYPTGNGFSYSGAWACFAGYPSGNVSINDINRGLFVVDPSEALGHGAPLINLTMTFGSVISGSIKELRYDDAQEVRFRSGNPPEDGVPLVTFVVDATSTVTPRTFVDVAFEVRSQVPGTGTLWLRNWTTGLDEVVMSNFAVTPNGQTLNATGLLGSKYVNSSGQIKARVQIQPNDDADLAFFDIFVDLVKLTVRRT